MTHPLTDKFLTQFGMPTDEFLIQFGIPDDQCVEGDRFFFEEDMRAAADWQLKQVVEFIKKEDTVYAEYIYKAMRPTTTQEDNS